ncbi:MAG: transketolase [Clostridiales bacterium]|nr:transketolase [Clostridiales bacterium]
MADQNEVKRLEKLAYTMRKQLIQLCCAYPGPVHIGGDLSMTDVLIALFHHGMKVNPLDIQDPNRDRFLLSKGHGAVCMYIAMALRGFFDFDKILETYGQVDSAYGMHPCKVQLPGVECSSGSLGQGLAMAVGMAISARHRGEGHRVFCMMGDGETCEGEIWEAAQTASSYHLGNLVGLVDRNKQFMTSYDGDFINLEPYADKWIAFGWRVIEVDGHDMNALVDVIDALPDSGDDKPTLLLCHTVKGKGVSFMEKNVGWHAGSLCEEDSKCALNDIESEYARNEGVE